MKSRTWMWMAAVYLFATLAVTIGLAAQDNPSQDNRHRHHHYKLVDVGTLGGPASYYSSQGPGSLILNEQGTLAGIGDTPEPDPYYPNCWDEDCYLARAFRFQNGVVTDLGALVPGVNSTITGINSRGWITGFSQYGVVDPLVNGQAVHGVLWTDRRMIDIGTPGGYFSGGNYVNDAGQVIGFGTINDVSDPYSFLGASFHAFIWQNGVMRDLGTLGGPDSISSSGGINQRTDLVVGSSYTSDIPNSWTGMPTQDPFLWKNGRMIDLGTLGGTIGGAQVANNRGQVIGGSNLAGDVISHAFFWDRGVMIDLGTLGGDNVTAYWLNDAGEVVGFADTSISGISHAFLWKRGTIHDLGQVGTDPCSKARAINSHEQIVGSGSDCVGHPLHAFLSENGGPLVDVNTLVSPPSTFTALIGYNINERGEIAGTGVPAGCDRVDVCGHVFLMIPCDEHHPGQCSDYSMIEAPDTDTIAKTVLPPNFKPGPKSTVPRLDSWSNGFGQRNRLPGQPAAPRD